MNSTIHNCESGWESKGMERGIGGLVTKPALLKCWHGQISQSLQENLRSQAHPVAKVRLSRESLKRSL